ncbi:MAG: biotin/lipoyl-binding protein, partial [Gemmataceae bacterium]|nr:biotin/lipoyl-binding protein [Gemmataceae bacterium]
MNILNTSQSVPKNNNASLEERVKSLKINSVAESQSMPKSTLFAWGLCVIMMGVAGLMAWRSYKMTPTGADSGQQKFSSQSSKSTGTDTVKTVAEKSSQPTVQGKENIVLEAKGYIIPMHQIQVSPKVPGMIEKLYVEEGKRVKKGDILAVLESVDYKADFDKAKAVLQAATQRKLEIKNGNRPEEIEQSKQEYLESLSNLEQLRSDLVRNRRLTGSASLSQREMDVASFSFEGVERKCSKLKSAYDLMVKGPREEKLKAAEAEVDQAVADLAKAQWRLNNCVIVAPVSGVILTKKSEEGNIINPAAFNISASLCEMADLTDLEVDLSIQERDVASV